MIEPIQVRIVKAIIRDLDNRMGLSEALRSVYPKSQIAMFETWMQLTAEELLKEGLIDKPHKPIIDVRSTHPVGIINRTLYYYEKDAKVGSIASSRMAMNDKKSD
jgi:hypothetical protein